MSVPQSVAFQPQSPILFDQTIRANILFGIADEDANEEFIQRSLEASTLSLDMDDSESTLHAKRELTRAGQGGSSLSGGQRARVALARCIYAALAGSECLILDDPIKALDPATAAQCWDHGIKGTMEGKTRILVVNSQMLQRFASDSAVSRLIIVENEGDGTPGRITYNGLPSELPTSVQERLGDGYSMSAAQPSTTEKARDTASTVGKDGGSATAVKPSKDKAKADSGAKEKSVAKKKPKKEDKEAGDTDKGNVPTAVANYCWRMGAWLLVSSTGMFTNQAGHLALYAWYGKWASDAFGFGFRSNYAIAIFVMLGTQLTRLFQGLTDGVGGELASKSIRVDVNQKLKVLAMPYLWDPQHSTAQLTDLVTKDPNEYRIFSMLPLLLSSAAFSIGTVLYARPVIAPFAVACLGCYKYVKKPFGWSIRQVYGGVILEAWISMRKFSGELFDASPTIRAMGRQPEFDTLITSKCVHAAAAANAPHPTPTK
jgi:ABC-type multidrug transport system ATPase subunit